MNSWSYILKAFISGASWPAFVLFFVGFHALKPQLNPDNCIVSVLKQSPYFVYTIIAPAYLGVMSVFAAWISETFSLSLFASFGAVSLVSAAIVSIAITLCGIYQFSSARLHAQYLRLVFYHFLVFEFIGAVYASIL
ncbi:MAG: hypothetical protein ACYCOU_17310 [Sulfobacillus sp.]